MDLKKDAVDWALIVSIGGLIFGIFVQQVQIYERVARIETSSQSETNVCDCINTRGRIGVLDERVERLQERLNRMEQKEGWIE